VIKERNRRGGGGGGGGAGTIGGAAISGLRPPLPPRLNGSARGKSAAAFSFSSAGRLGRRANVPGRT